MEGERKQFLFELCPKISSHMESCEEAKRQYIGYFSMKDTAKIGNPAKPEVELSLTKWYLTLPQVFLHRSDTAHSFKKTTTKNLHIISHF